MMSWAKTSLLYL